MIVSPATAPAQPDPSVVAVALPEWLERLASLDRVDYADCFAVDGGAMAAPIDWARAMLADAPLTTRAKLTAGWLSLGLIPARPGGARQLLGWAVREADDTHVVLARGSTIGMPAELVFARDGDRLLFATVAEHNTPLARALWRRFEAPHREIVPALLAAAARRLAATWPHHVQAAETEAGTLPARRAVR